MQSAKLIFVKFETVRSSTIEFGTTENNLRTRIYERIAGSQRQNNFLVEMLDASLQEQKHICWRPTSSNNCEAQYQDYIEMECLGMAACMYAVNCWWKSAIMLSASL